MNAGGRQMLSPTERRVEVLPFRNRPVNTASTPRAGRMNDMCRPDRATGSTRPSDQRRHAERRAYPRWVALATVVSAAAGLTACSSGSPDPSHVASLGSTTTRGGHRAASTTTAPKSGDATQLMDEWASCMRANGDPGQTDPVIDQYGVINITIPDGVSQTLSSQVHGSTGPCSQYELAAENDLQAADPVAPAPTQAQLTQYVDCMRTHGVPNYPNSGPNGETDFRAAGVDPNSPTFENANDVCGKQINAPSWWIAGTGRPGEVSVESAGIGTHGPTGSHPPAGGPAAPQGPNGGSGEVTHGSGSDG